jgi:hypothetical protein
MKVRSKAPTTWKLKSHIPIGNGEPNVIDVKVNRVNTDGKTLLKVYNVNLECKVPTALRKIWPDEYLQATRNQNLDPVSRSALQSVYTTVSVLREQRILATKSMALGRDVWRRIFFQMKTQRQCLRTIKGWHRLPFYYLKDRYLGYCIDEIRKCKHKVFTTFGFSYADLRNDPIGLKPKAAFLKEFRTRDKVAVLDSSALQKGLQAIPTGEPAKLRLIEKERIRRLRRIRRREKRD